jgi:hypothetical protein
MPDDDGGVDAQRINDADHVADKMHQRVLVDILRTVGLTVAAHVRSNGMEPSICQCVQLVTPRVPRLGKPVAEEYERALALFGEMDANPVRRNEPVSRWLLSAECHQRRARDSRPDDTSHGTERGPADESSPRHRV